MSDQDDVLAAATQRAAALAAGDAAALTALLHPDFVWSTHTGQRFDRASYVGRNTGGTTVWRGQELLDPRVVVGDAAVLTARVVDTVVADGVDAVFSMPLTLTWVRDAAHGWRCLAGHAGPRDSPAL